MRRTQHLPDLDRLSTVAAAILLAYALARYVSLPSRLVSLQLPGLYLGFDLNFRTFVVLIVAGLTASGAEWLLRQHPALQDRIALEHWLLPALTAWVIGIPLLELPLGWIWWLGFVIGGATLMLVLVAEYIVIDHDDIRQPPAAAGLTVLSFGLFLFMSVSLRLVGIRLLFLLPTITLGGGLVCLRTLHLRLRGRWAFAQAFTITLIIGQLTAALYYWRISPVSFGLILTGVSYALTSFFAGLEEGLSPREASLEPAIILGILWGAAAWNL